MSGIYGSSRKYSAQLLAQKVEQLTYRALARVLDLTATEMSVVMDGAFYNQVDEAKLMELYRQHGVECLHYLNGDFAFVIYDPAAQQLFGAVDRIGSKPLYYSLQQGFEFCSHLLPICIGNEYSVDEYARQCYFAMQYVPAPYSMVHEVKKLAAAEYFVYDISKGTMMTDSYWDLYANTSHYTAPTSFEEAVANSESLLSDAVKIRMSSDRDTALFLSGGIDSSVVAKYATTYSSRCKAYAVSFQEGSWDESSYSSKVAELLGLEYNKLLFTCQDSLKIIQGLQHYYDEPIGDASAIPTSFLCEKAGLDTTAALCGDGGDEVFFGYPRYLRYANRQKVYAIPRALRLIGAAVADIAGKKREALSLRMKDVQTLYLNRRQYYPAERFDARQIQQSIAQRKYLYDNKEVSRAFNDFDIKTVLPYELCVKMDRASARARIKTGAPLLDYRLLEYSRMIPTQFLCKEGLGQKSILREILYRSLPYELFERHKRGFGVPINSWFRGGLKEYLTDTVTLDTMKMIPEYDAGALIQMRDDHISGTADYAPLLWMIVNYIEWNRMFDTFCDQ
jgi:asparagine synthase (glutamine-hydrolysing)